MTLDKANRILHLIFTILLNNNRDSYLFFLAFILRCSHHELIPVH